MPNFPSTEVKKVQRWTNYSATIERDIETFCTILDDADDVATKLRQHGAALRAILQYCFDHDTPVRTMGSRWSFSKIIQPDSVAIDPPNMNVMVKFAEAEVTDGYRDAFFSAGRRPVFVEGGTTINRINARLGVAGLALQTSGAGDGHRVAGCLATGTHGSALGIGAVHDTVLGVYLMVAPDKALFVLPADPAITDAVPTRLAEQFGIPTEVVKDDELFAAALVTVGSLGIVLGVVLDTVPLYRLDRLIVPTSSDNQDLKDAITNLDSHTLWPARADHPYHFEVLFHPYPSRAKPSAYVTVMWKIGVDGTPFAGPSPIGPKTSSDVMGLVGALAGKIDGASLTPVVRLAINAQLAKQFQGQNGAVFPGQAFGVTDLPAGTGASTEITVDHAQALVAIDVIASTLEGCAKRGDHLLGVYSTRYLPQTRALLGMNIRPMNCCIELPSIRSPQALVVYAEIRRALRAAAIPYACHWGQLPDEHPAIETWFGDRVQRWKDARATMLDARGLTVFASPLLKDVGLG